MSVMRLFKFINQYLSVQFYKSVLIIEYDANLLNIFMSVMRLFKNNNSLNEKFFADSLQKMSQKCVKKLSKNVFLIGAMRFCFITNFRFSQNLFIF